MEECWVTDKQKENSLLQQVFDGIFTDEEWDLWVKGEFNLFDNYAERVGMTEDQINKMKGKLKVEGSPKGKKSLYEYYLNNPIDFSKLNKWMK